MSTTYSRTAMIPLRSRESFFRDPFFSDCWDMMDRRRRDWERETNLRSREFMSDFDDMERDMGFGRMGRLFGNRDRGYDLLEKDDLLKSSTAAASEANGFGLQSDKDNFKVLLDVQQFSPEELSVKTCDNSIVIEGKHEEKKDPHGFVSRHFTRKYTVPSDVKIEDVQCNLSSDGVLHVTAPRVAPAITNKTTATATATSTEQRRSAEKETAATSTEKRRTPDRRSAERTTLNDEFKSSFGLRESDRLGRDRSRLFDSWYAGFPDFDLVPFWRRRDWSGGQGEIIESRDHSLRGSFGVLSDRDNFKVQLDVQQFTPEELSVKTVDNMLVVEGKHEDKKDSLGYVARHFTRKYDIPSDVKPEDVKCSFSSDGHLVITAPRQKPAGAIQEKVSVIPISVQHQSTSSNSNSIYSSSNSRKIEQEKKSATAAEEFAKQHGINFQKRETNSPLKTANGVHIEEHISRSSSNGDAHKEVSKTEGIVKYPGEHIIPITNGA